MARTDRKAGLSVRVNLRPDVAIGPGKADLLAGIRDTGSIAAAGRRMGMSYTRAWSLVETMNRDFRTPLVVAAKGGAARGGAVLTKLGAEVLTRYRRLSAASERAAAADVTALRKKLS